MHTMTKIHAEDGPKIDPQMWDLPVDFYIVVHIPEVPHPSNED